MFRSFLLGAIAGARSMTPLAAVSDAAKQRILPANNGGLRALGHPIVAAGTKALAAGELAGDKMDSAPDRIVAPGIAARIVAGAIVGASIAPREQRMLAALLGVAGAVSAAFVTFDLRMRAIRRFGQKPTGLVEDALVLGATHFTMKGATLPRAQPVQASVPQPA
ncbi:DUF4126 family protein [Sphingopyxis sp. PAMC25046]|uniref:DUF4126 family protein n=1 Tax=Sphingopyxis sp. PAMC25046 TaxID=2565556 RepID=UPI00109E35B7|nr:DUF4126 family protein [Sphingopyxis sp. PAMC25046]QCB55716.1 DUF4126 family protein [Sphingopyxis sp. PAMC25046]